MGKFFNEKIKNNYGQYIKIGIICLGVILIFIIFALIIRSKNKTNIIIYEDVTVEVNDVEPTAEDLFESTGKINYDEIDLDYSDFDITTIGEYIIIAEVKGKSYEIPVTVVDTTMPELELRDLEIGYGEEYNITDFVSTCEDNSSNKCELFYENASDAEHKEAGTYSIKIKASDESGNETEYQDVTLTIIDNNEEPIISGTCSYGDLSVNKIKYNYPIAVIVGDQYNNCALDKNLWDSEKIQEKATEIYSKDYKRLQEELKPILTSEYTLGAKVIAQPHYIAVINASKTGLVGYAILVEIYIGSSTSEESIESEDNKKIIYYIKQDGTRQYTLNTYNLTP